jgi:hypothetical protein
MSRRRIPCTYSVRYRQKSVAVSGSTLGQMSFHQARGVRRHSNSTRTAGRGSHKTQKIHPQNCFSPTCRRSGPASTSAPIFYKQEPGRLLLERLLRHTDSQRIWYCGDPEAASRQPILFPVHVRNEPGWR